MQIVYGLNPVLELLKAGRRNVHEVIYSREEISQEIVDLCREKGIPLKRGDVERYAPGAVHQGIVAKVSPYPYLAEKEMDGNFLLLLDGIEDPRNFGAVIRSAYAFGVDGVFIPQKGSAKVTPVVVKSSAGTSEWMKISIVKKTDSLVKRLKEKGFFILSLDPSGKVLIQELNLPEKILLILGGEGAGIRKSLLRLSDEVVRIDTKVSLNVSVACGIALFFISRILRRE